MTTCARCGADWLRAGLTDVAGAGLVCPRCAWVLGGSHEPTFRKHAPGADHRVLSPALVNGAGEIRLKGRPASRGGRGASRPTTRAVGEHLRFLLSSVFDGPLLPEHLADLRASGLTDATIRLQRFRSVPLDMLHRGKDYPAPLGIDLPRACTSAMLLSYADPAGGWTDHVRIKVYPPITGHDGHQIKYLSARGSAPRLFFPWAYLGATLEGTAPLYVAEGEKKALAVAQLGLPAVGIAGVEGWHAKGSRALLPDFDAIDLIGRDVLVVPDTDVQENGNVARAVDRLLEALRARGASARIVVLPAAVNPIPTVVAVAD